MGEIKIALVVVVIVVKKRNRDLVQPHTQVSFSLCAL